MNLLLPKIKLYKRHPENREFGYTDTYGSLKLIENYSGKPLPLKRPIDWFYWTHGCHGPWRMVHPGLLTGNVKNKTLKYLVESKEQELYLKRHGYKNAIAVGLPIIYVKDVQVSRIPNSLLIMPSHTLQGNNKLDQEAYDIYIKFLKPYLKYFDVVKVCLHQGCLANNMWVDEFTALGIDIIEGAHPEDENALLRQKYLFKQFDYVTSNNWGSHVAYALFFGCKLSIAGPYTEMPKKEYLKQHKWAENPELVDLLLGKEMNDYKLKVLKNTYIAPHKVQTDVELGKRLVGYDSKKTPEELIKILRPKASKIAVYYLTKLLSHVRNKSLLSTLKWRILSRIQIP